MVQIVFVFCMLASPAQCQEQRIPGVEVASINECMTNGQSIAIRWLEDHPKWMLARWRCVKGGDAGEPA
jgi:hypothetical protein